MQKNLKAIFGDQPNLDEKSVDFLTRALDKNNLPGFDYLEYKQALRALRQMGMEDEVAFKSAFATASTMGLTKEKLVKSADHYKKVLSQEQRQFEEALKKQTEQRVQSKIQEVNQLKQQIAVYQSKIQELQQQMSQAQQTIESADEVITTQQQKIDETKHNFETALNSILDQINGDIQSIQQFLQ